ncbi:hypothetical protein [Streptomyces clavuligerus]|uniref:Uncharacterized protein n=1 Tax=Streptomyces clavuligerus TaxID=1901 RepID=B5GPF1_STRCL|nr:hypothetical protein [Streptomyces clavuligerus]ANW19654.1 hypothetical protein BB341_16210 [Streptomyces clavuligerus]AXU14264.1 hypothetical protein D1794_16920 [Streptomyces clavuligerus]EDY48197.1 hypothetical protein SSCG_01478 [Streptomyces clavuligerus]EFG07520.1 Hypothetical protein SCLAV_2447 [Streptomyces clavuligerus]MBY6304266.1 hypothetical protein [Streptomyces clavuligerus]
MADPQETVQFKTLAAQASAVLLTRGVEVETTAVHGVVAHLVGAMAERVGTDKGEAVHLVTPEAVAEIIVKAAGEREPGAAPPHAVRPVRVNDGLVRVRVESLGHLVMATAQAGKYASLNGDGPMAAHLLDLGTEVGAALVQRHAEGEAEIPVGVLDEVADRVDTVADRVETAGLPCPSCGTTPHSRGGSERRLPDSAQSVRDRSRTTDSVPRMRSPFEALCRL